MSFIDQVRDRCFEQIDHYIRENYVQGTVLYAKGKTYIVDYYNGKYPFLIDLNTLESKQFGSTSELADMVVLGNFTLSDDSPIKYRG